MTEPLSFSPEDITQIALLRGAGLYPEAYRYAANVAKGGEGVDPRSITWLFGAAQVNAGTGFYSGYPHAWDEFQTSDQRQHFGRMIRSTKVS